MSNSERIKKNFRLTETEYKLLMYFGKGNATEGIRTLIKIAKIVRKLDVTNFDRAVRFLTRSVERYNQAVEYAKSNEAPEPSLTKNLIRMHKHALKKALKGSDLDENDHKNEIDQSNERDLLPAKKLISPDKMQEIVSNILNGPNL